ncbi:hypothetical protein [Nocardia brasiliensis]|nr:hypothetical protein [Nocardia brasiliensis]
MSIMLRYPRPLVRESETHVQLPAAATERGTPQARPREFRCDV